MASTGMKIFVPLYLCFLFLLIGGLTSEEEQNPDRIDPLKFEVAGQSLGSWSRTIGAMTGHDGSPSWVQVRLFERFMESYHSELRRSDLHRSDVDHLDQAVWNLLPRFDFELVISSEDTAERILEYQRVWSDIFVHAQVLRKWGHQATQFVNKREYLGLPDEDALAQRLYFDVAMTREHMEKLTSRIEMYIRQLRDMGAFETDKPTEIIGELNHMALHAVRQDVMMGWTLYMNSLVNAYDPDVPTEPVSTGGAGPSPRNEYSRETIFGRRINYTVIDKLCRIQRFNISDLLSSWYGGRGRDPEFIQFMRLSDRRRHFSLTHAYSIAMRDRHWPSHFPSREEGWTGPMEHPYATEEESE